MGLVQLTRNIKRPGSAERAAIDTAQRQQGLAMDLAGAGGQLRGEIMPQLLALLRGESPSSLAAFGPIRQTLESQFSRARENILGNTPLRGGQLGQSLANLEMGRAENIFGLESDIRRQGFNQALSAGFQLPLAASNILGSSANINLTLAQQRQAQMQGTGQAAGQKKGMMTMMAMAGRH